MPHFLHRGLVPLYPGVEVESLEQHGLHGPGHRGVIVRDCGLKRGSGRIELQGKMFLILSTLLYIAKLKALFSSSCAYINSRTVLSVSFSFRRSRKAMKSLLFSHLFFMEGQTHIFWRTLIFCQEVLRILPCCLKQKKCEQPNRMLKKAFYKCGFFIDATFFVLRTLEYDIFKGTFGLSFFPPRCLQRQANLLLRRLLPPPPPLQARPPQHQGEGGEEGGLLAGVSQHSQLDPQGGFLVPDVINWCYLVGIYTGVGTLRASDRTQQREEHGN